MPGSSCCARRCYRLPPSSAGAPAWAPPGPGPTGGGRRLARPALPATRTGPDGAPPPEALAGARALLRARLQEIVEEPTVAEGLFIASPSLSGSLRYWREDPDSKRGRRGERSLVPYFGRMCMRATPF